MNDRHRKGKDNVVFRPRDSAGTIATRRAAAVITAACSMAAILALSGRGSASEKVVRL